MQSIRAFLSRHLYGYEHDWTNDFYLKFYDKNGKPLPASMMSCIQAYPTSNLITSGQNPNKNQPFCVTHEDTGDIHNCWVVGRKGSSGVASSFSSLISGGHGAAIGLRDDYDQKTQTGMPQKMNFYVECHLYLDLNGQNYSTSYIWGMVGADPWKVFGHAVKDVAKDIFKDTVMEELEIPEEIAETVSVMDAANDTKDILSSMESNYYFAVIDPDAQVRKINWGRKSGRDGSAIITPLVDEYGEVSDKYVLFKTGDSYNEIQVFLVQ
jgi:hypothetical protein